MDCIFVGHFLAQGCHTCEQCATCHASAKQQEQGCNCLMSRANTRLCTVRLAQGCAISDLCSDLCRTASSLGILAQGCHTHEQCDTCHATTKLQELGCNCLMSRLKKTGCALLFGCGEATGNACEKNRSSSV